MTVVVNSQQGAVGTTAATTQAITPTGIVAGRSLVLLAGTAGGATGTMTGVADTSGSNVWTLPDPPKVGVTSVTNTFCAAAYCHNVAAPGTITATFGSIANRKLLLLEITGLQNAPHDTAGEDGAAATSLTNVAPSVVISQAAFVICFCVRGGTAEPTGVTAGFTATTAGLPDLTAPILRGAFIEYSDWGSTGTCGFTFAASAQAGLGTIAFKVPIVRASVRERVVRVTRSGA